MPDRELTALPEGFEPRVPLDRCFDARYGLRIVTEDVDGDGGVQSRVGVGDEVRNHLGCVPVGVFATIAEAIASRGTALAVIPGGRLAMGMSNDTTLTRDLERGMVLSDAQVQARGDDAWVWSVQHRDDEGRVCAFSRVTVAVR